MVFLHAKFPVIITMSKNLDMGMMIGDFTP